MAHTHFQKRTAKCLLWLRTYEERSCRLQRAVGSFFWLLWGYFSTWHLILKIGSLFWLLWGYFSTRHLILKMFTTIHFSFTLTQGCFGFALRMDLMTTSYCPFSLNYFASSDKILNGLLVTNLCLKYSSSFSNRLLWTGRPFPSFPHVCESPFKIQIN